MKLLFDQNISFRILKSLPDEFNDSIHTSQAQLNGKRDIELWKFAKKNEFTIVSFDADFCDIANLKGHPPKIIWLRLGNSTTNEVLNKLITNLNLIKTFIESPESKDWACLEIY